MTGNNVDFIVSDEVEEIEALLTDLEDWSSEMFANDWREIENSGCISPQWYEREKNAASERNFERLLKIERLRVRLLCSL